MRQGLLNVARKLQSVALPSGRSSRGGRHLCFTHRGKTHRTANLFITLGRQGSVVSVVFLHPRLGQGTQGLLDGTPSLLSSRIAKSTAGATTTADFEQNGFEVISVTGPDMCSDDHSRVLIGQLLGAFAQYEKAAIVLKLRGATWPVWLGMTFVPGLLCPQR
jgi:hypothetical protein